jgi:gliding motility-associated-like protein
MDAHNPRPYLEHFPGPCRIFLLSVMFLLSFNTRGKGQISLTVTINPVTYESIGVSLDQFLNLIYVINYNGSIHLTATGGTPPYYMYSPGTRQNASYQNTTYFNSLGPGTYDLVVTDANGLTKDTMVTVGTAFPQPSVALSNIVYPSTCGSADGSFTLTGLGGTPPYMYSIDNGASFTANGVFTNLTQGAYSFLLVKDANGFLATTGFNANLTSGNYFTCRTNACCTGNFYVYPARPATCSNNDGSIEAFTQDPNMQFSIDGTNYFLGTLQNNPNSGPQYNFFFNGLAPGLHRIYGKDGNGNVAVQSMSILKGCGISANSITVNAGCQQSDGSVTFTASDGVAPYAYSLDGFNFQASGLFPGLSSGLYHIWVRDAVGSMTDLVVLLMDQCPLVYASETDETCGQKNATITASGYLGTAPYQFSIDGSTFQTSGHFTALAAGNYTVTLKDAGNFTATTPVTIKNNCLQLTTTVSNTTCSNNNGSIIVSGSGGVTPYEYSIDGNASQRVNTFTNLLAGNYTITISDAGGLRSSALVTITDAPGPQMNTALTPASCSNINGSIALTALGGTAPLQYSIDNGNNFEANAVFNGLDSGQYIARIKDANGCMITDTIQLTALPTPKVTLGPDTSLCNGQTLLLLAPQAVGYQYLWQDNSTADHYTVSNPGIFYAEVTNSFNCRASDTIHVRFRQVPVFSIGKDTVLCTGQDLLVEPVIQQALPVYTYLWSNGSTNPKSIQVTGPGIYWLQVSDSGCKRSDTILVGYKANPQVDLVPDTTLCDGETLLLEATNSNASYLWQDGSTQPDFIVSKAGKYSVKVEANGCDTTAKAMVSYIGKPVISLGNDTTLCVTEQLLLNAAYPQSSYLWQDGSTQGQYKVTGSGTYSVNVTNTCGTTTDSITVTYDNCACKFYVPSGFSPNNDGKNDTFLPKYQCVFTSYALKVYNRYGQLVFASTNPAKGWDGNLNNQPQPSGTYVWELVYKDSITGKTTQKTGTIILIR